MVTWEHIIAPREAGRCLPRSTQEGRKIDILFVNGLRRLKERSTTSAVIEKTNICPYGRTCATHSLRAISFC